MNQIKIISSLVLFFGFSVDALAYDGREDYDIDGDGLIEIYDWLDLNETRNNLDGRSLYGSSQGCPEQGCFGFELEADLNFDTNEDGILDENDLYWNEGKGWQPISQVGQLDEPFEAVFEGNYHAIKNLFINRPNESQVALFGYVRDAEFKNFSLSLNEHGITGAGSVAVLIGSASNSKLENIVLMGSVTAESTAAGAIASALGAELKSVVADVDLNVERHGAGLIGWGIHGAGSWIEGCYTLGSIKSFGNAAGGSFVNGLVASSSADFPSTVKNSYSLMTFEGGELTEIGGLTGANSIIINSYFSGDLHSDFAENFHGLSLPNNEINQENSYWSVVHEQSVLGNVGGVDQLKCPIEPDDINCGEDPIYSGWPTVSSSQNGIYWDFGSRDNLPALVSLPKDLDTDQDGTPDAWELDCTGACQSASSASSESSMENKGAGAASLISLLLGLLLIGRFKRL